MCLNNLSGAGQKCLQLCADLASRAGDRILVGAEFGVAYGGGVQAIGRAWRGKGTIHGFDTFTGQPKECGLPGDPSRDCMDMHYRAHGRESLDLGVIQRILADEGLVNVVLHSGLITPHSMDGIPSLDYCLLDLYFEAPMRMAWSMVDARMVAGGYLCLHDALGPSTLPGLLQLMADIAATGRYTLVSTDCFLAVFTRN